MTAHHSKGHGVHSPFVYQLIQEVLKDSSTMPSFEKIESIRKRLLKDKTVLQVDDYGAGSVTGNKKQRSISSIAGTALKSPKYARLLFRLAHFTNAKNMIELGTSLGITSAYMASASPDSQLITFEGAAAVADLAQSHFTELQLNNIHIVKGPFDESLQNYEAPLSHDLIYIDGNHTCEATLRYFHFFLPRTHEYSLMIFDDIHWSKGMEEAWEKIKQHPSVTLTIDLFFIGLVFFRKSQLIPQHFSIRY